MLPPLFPVSVVYQAFEGLRHVETVRRLLKDMNAFEGRGLVKPDVLQDHFPTIHRKCCAILIARSVEGEP